MRKILLGSLSSRIISDFLGSCSQFILTLKASCLEMDVVSAVGLIANDMGLKLDLIGEKMYPRI